MNDKIIRRLVALFAVIAAVLVVVAIVAVRNITRAVASSDWVNQTHAVILELGELRAAFHYSDAALRTLAMTGNEQDEAAGRDALSNLEEHLEIAKALTRSDASQAQQVGRLEALTLARSQLTRDVLAARKAGQLETVRSLLAADTAAGGVAEVRRLTDKLKMDQMALLASRDTAAYLQAQTTRWTVWTGVALNFLLLGFTAWLVMDDIAARRRAAVIMQEANEQLETKVRERTAELTSANAALTAEILERRWGAQALEHQLRYNVLIVNSISDLVFVLTKAQNITRINPAVGQLTGWESTKVINRPLAEFVRLTEAPRHAPPRWRRSSGPGLERRPGSARSGRGHHRSGEAGASGPLHLLPAPRRQQSSGGNCHSSRRNSRHLNANPSFPSTSFSCRNMFSSSTTKPRSAKSWP